MQQHPQWKFFQAFYIIKTVEKCSYHKEGKVDFYGDDIALVWF
jgi:hypothetical protein